VESRYTLVIQTAGGCTHRQTIGAFKFEPHDSIHENSTIHNIAAADFNYDGKLDLLVVGEQPGLNATLYVHLYFGDYRTFSRYWKVEMVNLPTVTGPIQVLPPAMSQLLIHDANADLLPDLFGISENGRRAFWMNEGATNFVVYVLEHQAIAFFFGPPASS